MERNYKVTTQQINEIVSRFATGETPTEIAKALNIRYHIVANYTITAKRRAENPELFKQMKRENERRYKLKKYYGITEEGYNSMYMSQGGLCASCGRAEKSNVGGPGNKGKQIIRNLSVDHNHSTGAIRGLLCTGCNAALGFVDDDPIFVQKLLNYLLSSNTPIA